MDKQSTQKRILFATLISFAFFIAYDYFYLMPKNEAKKQQMAMEQNKSNATSATSQASNTTAPVKETTTSAEQAPVSSGSGTIISTIKTKLSVIQIDNLGRIAQVTMNDTKYQLGNKAQVKLFDPAQLKPLEVRFANTALNDEAFKVNYIASSTNIDATSNAQEITLKQQLKDTNLTKKLKFYPDGHYDVDISSSKADEFFVTTGFRPNVLADNYTNHGALLKQADNTFTTIQDKDIEKIQNVVGVKIASAFDRYYSSTIYNLKSPMNVFMMPNSDKSPQIFISVKQNFAASGYIGPKDYDLLASINPELTDVIEYGWFTFIANPMFLFLKYLYNLTGNWGWAIVLLTIIVKLVLYPLSYKGMVSMQKLKNLAPKIKDLQEKYKGDSQKLGMHMMELYKKHDANPMGGCLPIILQIPVFFAIYRVLLNAIELEGAEWILWIDNLAVMDQYFILPILMGVTMYIQQRITPTTITDPIQQKMFQWLPIVFTVFFLWFPAGLTLYWFVNNLFTVSQQYYINQLFEKRKLLKAEQDVK